MPQSYTIPEGWKIVQKPKPTPITLPEGWKVRSTPSTAIAPPVAATVVAPPQQAVITQPIYTPEEEKRGAQWAAAEEFQRGTAWDAARQNIERGPIEGVVTGLQRGGAQIGTGLAGLMRGAIQTDESVGKWASNKLGVDYEKIVAANPLLRKRNEFGKSLGEYSDKLNKRIESGDLRKSTSASGEMALGNWRWWTEGTSEFVPQLAVQIGAAAATAGTSLLAQLAAFGGTALVMEGGNAYNAARTRLAQKGYSDEEAAPVAALEATMIGSINGAMEMIPGITVFKKNPLAKTVFNKFLNNAITQRVGKITAGSVAEGVTEGVQEAWGDTVQWMAENDPQAYGSWKRYVGVAALGAASGGGMASVVSLAGMDHAPSRTEWKNLQLDPESGRSAEQRKEAFEAAKETKEQLIQETQNAIPERETEAVPTRETPGDREAVGQEVREQDSEVAKEEEKVPVEPAAEPVVTPAPMATADPELQAAIDKVRQWMDEPEADDATKKTRHGVWDSKIANALNFGNKGQDLGDVLNRAKELQSAKPPTTPPPAPVAPAAPEPTQTPKTESAAVEKPTEPFSEYTDWKQKELVAEVKKRGLKVAGRKKAELQASLEADDKAKTAAKEKPAEPVATKTTTPTSKDKGTEATIVENQDTGTAIVIWSDGSKSIYINRDRAEKAITRKQKKGASPEAVSQPAPAAKEKPLEPAAKEPEPSKTEFGKDVSGVVGAVATVPITPPRGGIGRSASHFFQRFFTTPGELTEDVYRLKVKKEGRVAKEMSKLRFAATDFRRGIRQALDGKELTQADVEKMNSVLRGEADMTTVPEELRAPLQAMRDHIDSLSRALIAEGVAQGDMIGIIDENMGVYATRSYRVFDDPKWRDKVPNETRNRAIAAVRAMYPDKSDAEVIGVVESLLYRGAAESPVALIKGSKLGSKDLSTFMHRKDVPEWLRELWGEYKDAGVNYARSVFKMSHLLANQEFLNGVRETGLGKWLRTEGDGPIVNDYGEVITKIAADESSVMSPLNGMYTTPEIKTAFERFDKPGAMPDWLRVIMGVNYAVKYGKTVGSVQTHIRNLISNTGFMVANGHWRIDKAGTAIRATVTGLAKLSDTKFREYYNRLAELGIVGEDVRSGEMKDALRDASRADIDDLLYNREARQAKKIIKVARGIYRSLNAAYQAEDALPKIYAFENEKARFTKAYPNWSETQVEEHAADLVRDTYPTYSKIPLGIKNLRRFPILGTFVSFPSEVVRTTFNTVRIGLDELKAPETRAIGAQRVAGTVIALGGLTVLANGMRMMLGIGDDEDDDLRWFVPPWQENSRFIYTAKPKDATYHFVDLGYSDPHAYLVDPVVAFSRGEEWKDKLWNSTVEFLRPFASEEILLKAVADLRSNEDEKIYNPKDTAGEQAKDMIAHLWNNALEFGTITSGRRIGESITGINPNRDTATEVTALLTGQRLQNVDVEHSLGFRVRDFSRALTTIQGIARKTATSRGTATGTMVATDLARMENLRLAEFAEIQKIVGAARRLGVPQETIETMLKDELSDAIAKDVLTGDYSKYEMTPETVRQMMDAKPEEFRERFSGWHGGKEREAAKEYAVPRLGGMPYKVKDPDDPEAVKEMKQTQSQIKSELDALQITYDQALQYLQDSFHKKDENGNWETHCLKDKPGVWKDSYRGRKFALDELYGVKP